MSFGAPMMLWLLLLLPAVLILWFLKIRRTPTEVASTLLWRRALQDERVRSPFQKLLRNLVLFLQLLAVLLAVLAIAAPQGGSGQYTSRLNLILVDSSASMNAIEIDGRSRFEQARERGLEIVDDISGERGIVIGFGSSAETLTPVTSDRSVLRKAISRMTPGSGTSTFENALEMALSIARQDSVVPMQDVEEPEDGEEEQLRQQIDARIFVISDGAIPGWTGDPIPVPVLLESVGEVSSNSGIVALAARREFSEEGDLRVVAEIRNSGDEVISGEVKILLDGEPAAEAQSRTLEGGERWTHSFSLLGAGDHEIEVLWNPQGGDALSLDDRAWLVAEQPRTIKIARVGKANILLDDALAVIPSVIIEPLTLEQVDPETIGEEFDVVVWDRVIPEVLPAGPGHLVLGAQPPQLWPDEIEQVSQPLLVAWRRDDPLLRYSQLTPIDGTIVKSFPLPQRDGVSPIAECREGALIARFIEGDVRGIILAFDVLDSPWPLSASFPFFIEAAIRDLARVGGGISGGLRSGDLIEVNAGGGVSVAKRIFPSGAEEDGIPVRSGGIIRVPAGEELGIHQMKWLQGQSEEQVWNHKRVPVNLLSPAESSIEPMPAIAGIEVGQEREAMGFWGVAKQHYWPWFLAFALGLMVVEWIVFHRR